MNRKIYFGGNIITLTEQEVESILVEDGKITYAGDLLTCMKMDDAPTELINLKGNTLVPGFHESHGHITYDCIMFHHLDLGKEVYQTFQEACTLISKRCDEIPEGDVLICMNYDESKTPEEKLFTRWDLDEISTTKKIILGHVSTHMGFVNSIALEESGYSEVHPQGVLGDKALVDYYMKKAPQPTLAYMEETILQSLDHCVKNGVTTMNDAGFLGQGFMVNDLLLKLSQEGKLKCQISKSISFSTLPHSEFFEKCDMLHDPFGNIHYIKTIKTFYDGSIQAATAYLSQPYADNLQSNRPLDYRSSSSLGKEALKAQVEAAYKNHYTISVHTNGDASIDDVLDAVAQAESIYGKQSIGSSLIHAQTMRSDQLDRAKELGVIPTFFNSHVYFWGDLHVGRYLGAQRGNRISPLQEAVDKGVVFSLHCDYPVIPENPLLAMHIAVNRDSINGNGIGKEFSISALEALKAYTLYPAIQTGEQDRKGTIEIGKNADFVILEDNPLTIDSKKIKDIRILETIVKGNVVYRF